MYKFMLYSFDSVSTLPIYANKNELVKNINQLQLFIVFGGL